MNCKPGDLAVIKGCDPNGSGRDIGKLVRIVGPGDDWSDVGDTRHFWDCDTLGQRLECDGNSLSDGFENIDIPDEHLRPIRDNDGEDETLQWAGKPEGVTA